MMPEEIVSDGATGTTLLQKLDLSRDNLIEMALYCGAGFILGFLLKKYNQYLFWLGLVVLALGSLHYFGLITITVHTDAIRSLVGCPSLPLDATCFSVGLHWTQDHARASISFLTGFVGGIWVG